mmetsp:Transcript_14159/g.21818  ORF Transcript_14159/g.21818 Transcript_14159/m.21818 type:complete len:285 (-) Transcript_14159:144-998(-)
MSSIRKRLAHNVKQVIVTNHTRLFEIKWYECFIVPIIFIAIVVTKFCSMAGIMKKNCISRLCLSNNFLISSNQIRSRRFFVLAIIHENVNILFLESMHSNNVLFHIQYIIVTAPQFARIVTHIIDSHHDSSTRSSRSRRHQIKIGIDIDGVGSRQLRNLRKALRSQIVSHLRQNLRITQIVFRNRVVLVQNAKQGGGTGTTSAACGIGQGKTGHIGHIGRSLGVFASRNHTNVLPKTGRLLLFKGIPCLLLIGDLASSSTTAKDFFKETAHVLCCFKIIEMRML